MWIVGAESDAEPFGQLALHIVSLALRSLIVVPGQSAIIYVQGVVDLAARLVVAVADSVDAVAGAGPA